MDNNVIGPMVESHHSEAIYVNCVMLQSKIGNAMVVCLVKSMLRNKLGAPFGPLGPRSSVQV